MEEIGVQAIVDGLMSFSSDMDKVQGKIDDVAGRGTILGGIFDSVSSALTSFGREILNVAEVALGVMLRDAIEAVISFLGDMIEKVIEAGNEFQILELRLNNFNMDALMKSGEDYDTAAREAIKLTKEQLDWLQKLAMVTPYDNTDISSAYTLGRAYGFTADQAKQLTENTADFASAMGLTGAHMERIIVNLGQMKARGKITSTELRDLARGAFLPLDDVLGRVAKSMGITTEELTKAISTPGSGVPYQKFIDAFNQMIEQEPRFVGASEKMARTLKYSANNVQDLVTSFGGLQIVSPIMGKLGERVAEFMDQFVKSGPAGQEFTDLGQKLLDSATSIGISLSRIISNVFALLPSANDLATTVTNALQGFADWLKKNEGDISVKLQNIVIWLSKLTAPDFSGLLKTLADGLAGVVKVFLSLNDQFFKVDPRTHKTGWEELGKAFFTLGVAVQPILDFFHINTTVLPTVTGLVDNLVAAINEVSKWIYNNQALIENILTLLIAYLIIDTVTGMFWSFVGALISVTAAVIALAAAFSIIVVIVSIVSVIIVAIKAFQFTMELLVTVVKFIIDTIVGQFQNMKTSLSNIMTEIGNAWRMGNWVGIGQAIVEGIARGIQGYMNVVITAARNAAMSAYNAAKAALGIKSPSTLFAGIGENLMMGMAQGITDSAGIAVDAMRSVVAAVSMPAMSMQVSQAAPRSISSTYQSNTTNNLNIYSQAQTEQVASDFAMMQSMAGI